MLFKQVMAFKNRKVMQAVMKHGAKETHSPPLYMSMCIWVTLLARNQKQT